ncbi:MULTISPECIES: hypothetical protein [Halorussus]|uniref:hypothetical protein n=1 Tax=Halorussus TaxID=1070314 RepID=UPI0020A03F47|nr:hypothetical protein [Halorussus vallis]USZ77786.1 hypothetical protein NGM07_21630 [Halorussus vallis]
MTRNRPAPTRRGFLALAGSAALAGCGGFGGGSGDEGASIDATALRKAVSGDAPTVPEPAPVEIERSYLDRTTARVREQLSSVPAPFDSREVPNGAIRAELTRMHEEATAELRTALDEQTRVETMERLRRARERARAVAAAWEAIDAGLAAAEVRATIPRVRADLDAFQRRWRYVGDRPVRAVVAHAQVEELVAFANHRLRRVDERASGRRAGENPVAVGKFAGDVESARAALADAEYLYDRYLASLADPRQIGSGLEAAGEALTSTLADRREGLPNGDSGNLLALLDRAVVGTPVAYALDELGDVDYADGLEDERATGRRASVVLSVHETLVRIRAFERLRERASNGGRLTVESADDVRAVRRAAIAAVEEVRDSRSHPLLDRRTLQVADGIGYADREIARAAENRTDGGVRVEWLTRELSRYFEIAAQARATPETSAAVAEVVRSRV